MTPAKIDRSINPDTAEDLALQKIYAAHEAARMPQGYNDPAREAEILYASLYDPGTLATMGAVSLRSEHQNTLYLPFDHYKNAPPRVTFVEAVYDTILTEGTPYYAFHNKARSVVEILYHRPMAQVTPWTQGHVEQQLSKVASLGIQLENQPYTRGVRCADPTWETLPMKGIAATDKFDDYSVTRLRQLTEGRQTVVAEDRYKNILRLRQTPGFKDTLGIWVIDGLQAHKDFDRLSEVVNDISPDERALADAVHRHIIRPVLAPTDILGALESWELTSCLDLQQPYGLILDFDGTLINSNSRSQFQKRATLAKLIANQWITPSP